MKNAVKVQSVISIVTVGVSIAGVITTAILASKAAPKAQKRLDDLKHDTPEPTKLEVIKAVAPAYSAAAVSGSLTIACIIGTSLLNRKSQASLASAYALLNHNYQRYRQTVKKIFGEDADQKVMNEIVTSECTNPPIYSMTGWGEGSLDFDAPEETLLFYDSYSERYFNSTISHVLQAEYHLNRNFCLGGDVSVNMFYEFLGLDPIIGGDKFVWDISGGIGWIDFNHRTVKLEPDGNLECLECHVIDFEFSPWIESEDYMKLR